ERISGLLPPRKQTLFFSATMPEEIRRLSEKFLRDPVQVKVARQATTAETIMQKLAKTGGKPAEKRQTLRAQIDAHENLTNAIIFCNRKRDIATLARSMNKHGYDAGPLHGDMDQRSRMATLETFKSGKLKFLIASDVAARGLDIPDVSHVFNFDVPTHPEDYVHRIGRTGRAGRSGTAVTLVAPADKKYLDAIEALIQKKISWASHADARAHPSAESGTKGKTSSKGARKRRKPAGEDPALMQTAAGPASKPAADAQPSIPSAAESQSPPKDAKKGSRTERSRSSKSRSKDPGPFGADANIPAFLLKSMT
ncbi:MAG TPA: DEAD/DEAH box helicase, partial [Devosia sp.]|nr:DEAD/DEAH box helicase [Devosia sp.]